jgi:hypothetical protein
MRTASSAAACRPGVTRVPDGEPGNRANWVPTQTPHFLANPTLDVITLDVITLDIVTLDIVESGGQCLARLRPSTTAADVRFNAFNFFVEFDSFDTRAAALA